MVTAEKSSRLNRVLTPAGSSRASGVPATVGSFRSTAREREGEGWLSSIAMGWIAAHAEEVRRREGEGEEEEEEEREWGWQV